VVYVGHAAIEKFDFTGHSNMSGRFIGGIECTSLERLGDCYDYIALGHIHKAQSIGRARYCGSPVPVGFDEVRPGYEHGFTVVEIESKGAEPKIEHIPLETVRPLVNIPSQGHAPWTEVMDELKAFPADIPAYIRLNVLLQDGQILPYDRQKQTDDALEGKLARCVNVNPVRELANLPDSNASATLQLTMDELQKEDPATILRQYAQQKGETFTDEFASMLETVIKNINSTADED
jgi:exonuclease SbcD